MTQPYMAQAPAQQQERETEHVVGTVQSVVVKGQDKWQVVVLPDGSQYTKNLWTKDSGLAQDMMGRVGQRFTFSCGVSHWVNQQGQQVRSLWINSVSWADGQPGQVTPQQQAQPAQGPYQPATQSYGSAPPPQQQAPRPQPAMAQRLPDEVREMRIMRMGAMKVAAALLPYLPPEQRNLSGLQQIAEWQVAYYTGGPQQVPWPSDGQQPYNPVTAQQPQGTPVDDIPFGDDPGREAGDPGPGFPEGF